MKIIDVLQVALNKYHTVFLTGAGKVYSCGHGLGGRLGHGDELTRLVCIMCVRFLTLAQINNQSYLYYTRNCKHVCSCSTELLGSNCQYGYLNRSCSSLASGK